MDTLKNLIFKYLTIFTIVFFAFIGGVLKGQTDVYLSGQKIKFEVETVSLSKPALQDKINNGDTVMRFKVYITLPPYAASGTGGWPNITGAQLGTGDFTFVIKDKNGSEMSYYQNGQSWAGVTARHLATAAGLPPLFASQINKDASAVAVISQRAHAEHGKEAHLSFQTGVNNMSPVFSPGVPALFLEYPVVIREAESFQLCIDNTLIQNNTSTDLKTCPSYAIFSPGNVNYRCPGGGAGLIQNFAEPYNAAAPFRNQENGGRTDFFLQSDRYSPLLPYTQLVCGGLVIPEGPTNTLLHKDTACPQTDFEVSAMTESPDANITLWKIEYSTNGTTWNTFAGVTGTGTGTWTYATGVSHAATSVATSPINQTWTSASPYAQTFKIAAANIASFHNARLRLISHNADGVDTTYINSGSPDGTYHANSTTPATIKVPALPNYRLALLPSAGTWKYPGDAIAVNPGTAAILAVTTLTNPTTTPPAVPDNSIVSTTFKNITTGANETGIAPDPPFDGRNTRRVIISQPTKYVAYPQFWANYQCEGITDTVEVKTPMTVTVTATKTVCEGADYCGLRVDYYNPSGTEPNITANTGVKLYKHPSGTAITIKSINQLTPGAAGAFEICIDAADAAALSTGDSLRVDMTDPVSAATVSGKDRITKGAAPALTGGGDLIAFLVGNNSGGITCGGSSVNYSLNHQLLFYGTDDNFNTAQPFNSIFTSYEVFSRYDANDPFASEGIFTAPSFNFVMDAYNEFRIVGTTAEGCEYTYGPCIIYSSGVPSTQHTNMYGDQVMCNDTIYIRASVPPSMGASITGWNWYGATYSNDWSYVYLHDFNGTSIATCPSGNSNNVDFLCPDIDALATNWYATFTMDNIVCNSDICFEIVGIAGSNTSTFKIWPVNESAAGKTQIADWVQNATNNLMMPPFWAVYQDGTNSPADQFNALGGTTMQFGYNLPDVSDYLKAPDLTIDATGLSTSLSALSDTLLLTQNPSITESWNAYNGKSGHTDYEMYFYNNMSAIMTCANANAYNSYLQKSVNGGAWQNATVENAKSGQPPLFQDKLQTDLVQATDITTKYRIHYEFCYAPTCMPMNSNEVTINLKAAEQIGVINVELNQNEPVPGSGKGQQISLCAPKDVNIDQELAIGIVQHRYEYKRVAQNGTVLTNWTGFNSSGTTAAGAFGGVPNGTTFPQSLMTPSAAGDTFHIRLIGSVPSKSFLDTTDVDVKIVILRKPDVTQLNIVPDTICMNQTMDLSMTTISPTQSGDVGSYLWGNNYSTTQTLASGLTTYPTYPQNDVTPKTSGSQTVYAKVTASNGCWDTVSKKVMVYDTAALSVTQIGADSAWYNTRQMQVTPTPSGTYTYQWYNNAALTPSLTEGGTAFNGSTWTGVQTNTLCNTPLAAAPGSNINTNLWVTASQQHGSVTCTSTGRGVLVTKNDAVAPPGATLDPDQIMPPLTVKDVCEVTTDLRIKVTSFSTQNDVKIWRKGSPDVDLTTTNSYAYNSADSTFTIPMAYFNQATPAIYTFYVTTSGVKSADLTFTERGYPTAGTSNNLPSDTLCLGDNLTVGSNMTNPSSATMTFLRKTGATTFAAFTDGSATTGWTAGRDTIRVVYSLGTNPVCTDTGVYPIYLQALPSAGTIIIDSKDTCRYTPIKFYLSGHSKPVQTILWEGNANTIVNGTVNASTGFLTAPTIVADSLKYSPEWATAGNSITLRARVVVAGCTTVVASPATLTVKESNCPVPTLSFDAQDLCDSSNVLKITNIPKSMLAPTWRITKQGTTDTVTLTPINMTATDTTVPFMQFFYSTAPASFRNPTAVGTYTIILKDGTVTGYDQFNVRGLPSKPKMTQIDSICELTAGTINLNATSSIMYGTPPLPAPVITYYSSHFATATRGSGAPYTVSVPASTTDGSYPFHAYATATYSGSLVCYSDTLDTVYIVKPLPLAPTISVQSPACLGDSVEFTITANIPATGDSVAWFDGASFLPTKKISNGVYKFKADAIRNNIRATVIAPGGCRVTSTNHDTLIVRSPGSKPTISPATVSICPGDVLPNLTVSNMAAYNPAAYQWFYSTNKTAWILLGASASDKAGADNQFQISKSSIPPVTDTVWFAIVVDYGACPDLGDTIMAVAKPRPVVDPSSILGDTICRTQGPINLTAGVQTVLSGTTTMYFLYENPTATYTALGSTPLSTNPVTLNLTNTTYVNNANTYKFSVYAVTDGCHSDTVDNHVFVVNPNPVAGTGKFDTLCRFAPLTVYMSGIGVHDSIVWYSAADVRITNGTTPAGFNKSATLVGDSVQFPAQWVTSPGVFVQLKAKIYLNGCDTTVTVSATENNCPAPSVNFSVSDICDESTALYINGISALSSSAVWKVTKQGLTSPTPADTIAVIPTMTATDTTVPFSFFTSQPRFLNPSVVGTYTIILEDGVAKQTVSFNIRALPADPNIIDIDSVCEGDSPLNITSTSTVTPAATVNTVYFSKTALFTQGSVVSGSPFAVPTTSRTAAASPYPFFVFAEVNYSGLICRSDTIDSTFVIKPIPPMPSIPALGPVCENDTVLLKLSTAPAAGTIVNWMNNGTPITTVKVDDVTYKYKVGTTDLNITASFTLNGCTGPVSNPAVVVKVNAKGTKPTIDASSISEICVGGTIDPLTTSAPTNASAYQWRYKEGRAGAWTNFGTTKTTTAAINTEFQNQITSLGTVNDTLWFALIDSFGVCPPTSDTVMIVVRLQPVVGQLTPEETPKNCQSGLTSGDSIVLDGLRYADSVVWYTCFSPTLPYLNCTYPSGTKKVTHTGMYSTTPSRDSVLAGTMVTSTSGFYTFRAVAGIMLTNPSANPGCKVAISDTAVIEITGSLVASSVNVKPNIICDEDSVIAWTDKIAASGHNFDYVVWYSSTDGGTTYIKADSVEFTTGMTCDTIVFKPVDVPASVTQFWVRAVYGTHTGCGFPVSDQKPVNVSQPPLGGTATPSDTVCIGSPNTAINLTGHTTGATIHIKWYDSVASASVPHYEGSLDDQTSYTAGKMTITEKTYFWAEVTNGVCPPVRSTMALIDTFARPVAANLGLDPTHATFDSACAGSSITLNSMPGSYAPNVKTVIWQYAPTPTGAWTTITNPVTMQPVLSNDGDTGYYRAIVYNSDAIVNHLTTTCPSDTSNNIVKIRWDKPVANDSVSIDAPRPTTCERDVQLKYHGGNPIPQNFRFLGWGHSENGGVTIPYMPLTTGTDTTVAVTIPAGSPSINFRFMAFVKNGACPIDTVTYSMLTVQEAPASDFIKTITEDTICCVGTSSTKITLNSKGTGTITWEYSTDKTNFSTLSVLGDSSATLTAGTHLACPKLNMDTTYWIRARFGALGVTGCPAAYSDTVPVVVLARPELTGGSLNALSGNICITADSLYVYSTHTNVKGNWKLNMKAPGASVFTVVASGNGYPITPYSVKKPSLLHGTYQFYISVENTPKCGAGITSTPALSVRVWDTIRVGTVALDSQVICPPNTVDYTVTGNQYGLDSAKNTNVSWLYRIQPATAWTGPNSSFSAFDTIKSTFFVSAAAPNTTYEIALALSNPGCGGDTSDFVTLKTIATPNKPTVSLVESVVCVDSAIVLTINNLNGGDSIEIKDGSTILATLPITPQGAVSMTYTTPKLTAGSHSFTVRNFVSGSTGLGCGSISSDVSATIRVNDSSDAGNFAHITMDPTALEKTINAGTNSGNMFLFNGIYVSAPTVSAVTITGQKDEVDNGTHTVLPHTSGWSGTIPGNSGLTLPESPKTYDTIGFRAIVQNAGCPADTSNWIWYYLKMSDTVITSASPTPVCVVGGTSTITATVPSAIETILTDEKWERIFYPLDGGAPVVTNPYKIKTDLTITPPTHSFVETYNLTDRPGTYLYVYHYQTTVSGGTWLQAPDSAASVQVDTLSVAGQIQIPFDELCQDSLSPLLTLNSHIGTVTGWYFSPNATSFTVKDGQDTAKYQVGNQPIDSGWYQVRVKNGVCPEVRTDSVLVQVYSSTVAGTITVNPVEPCYMGTMTVTATGINGQIVGWAFLGHDDPAWDTMRGVSVTNPWTWAPARVYGEIKIAALIRNSGYCPEIATPVITIHTRDTLQLNLTAPNQCVVASDPSQTWTVLAEGFAKSDPGYSTIPASDIEYVWQMRTSSTGPWFPIGDPNAFGITGAMTATITIPDAHYKTYPDYEYRVYARQKASTTCNDSDTLYVGKVCIDLETDLGPIDPRCIFVDSTVVIEPDYIKGKPTQYKWFWTPVGGGPREQLLCDASQKAWVVEGCDTSALKIFADDPYTLNGSKLTLWVTDGIRNDSVEYIICIDTAPTRLELIGDTVCVNGVAEFTVNCDIPPRADLSGPELTFDWFRISGTDTLAITLSKSAGTPQRPDGTAGNLLGGEVLANYSFATVNSPNGFAMPMILHYNGTPKAMDGFRYAVRVSSPKTTAGVRMEPPRWIDAKLTVVDSLRIHQDYPKNDTICNLTSATICDSILQGKPYTVNWFKYNPATTTFTDTVGTGDCYTTSLLTKDSVLYYRYEATNICNTVTSRIDTLIIRELPTVTVNVNNTPICENSKLAVTATHDAQDSLEWFVNGVKIPVTGGYVNFPDKDGNIIQRLFRINGDSVILDPTDKFMDSVKFMARVADKRCTNPGAWVADSIIVRVNETPVFSHPGDETVMFDPAAAPDTVHISFPSTSTDPSITYQWYWTTPYLPNNPSYDELVAMFGGNSSMVDPNAQLYTHLFQQDALDSMTAIGAHPDIEMGTNTTNNLGIILRDKDTYDSIMVACVVTSNICGVRIDTTMFARLVIVPMPTPCPPTRMDTIYICTDNIATRDSQLIIREALRPTIVNNNTYQWYYWDQHPEDSTWRKLDPRLFLQTRRDTAIFNPAKAYMNQYWFIAHIDNQCWSDTIVAIVNLTPTFITKPHPLWDNQTVGYRIWPEEQTLPTSCPGDPHRLGELGASFGYPATLEQVFAIYGPNAMIDSVQALQNIVQYEWYRTNPAKSNNFVSEQRPLKDDTTNGSWTLCDSQVRVDHDSMRVALRVFGDQASGNVCQGESDTVMILVPNCYVDSINILFSPEACEGNLATVTAYPQTDQVYEWYYHHKDSANPTLIDTASDPRFQLNGNQVIIPTLTKDMDSMLFNCRIVTGYDYSCPLNEQLWTSDFNDRLKLFRAPQNVKLKPLGEVLAGNPYDTLVIYETEANTPVPILIEPTNILNDYVYEWYVITPVGDSLIRTEIAPNYGISLVYDAMLNGYKLYAKVFSPAGCDSSYSDTIVIRPISQFSVSISEIMSFCDGSIAELRAKLDPSNTIITSWQWLSQLPGGSLTPITGSTPNVIRWQDSVLQFSTLSNSQRVSTYMVVACNAAGVCDTSLPARVEANASLNGASSKLTRIPPLGTTICLPEGGAIDVTYHAHAYVNNLNTGLVEPIDPAANIQYRWHINRGGTQEDKGWQNSPTLVLPGVTIADNGAIVTCQIQIPGCGDVWIEQTDTLKLQSIGDIEIAYDTNVLCSTTPISFTVSPEFASHIFWEAPTGKPDYAYDTNTFTTTLSPSGVHVVTVRVEAIGGGCAAYDTVYVDIKPGPQINVKMDNIIRNYMTVNVGEDVDLEIVFTDTTVDPATMAYLWQPLNFPIFPVSPADSQKTKTSVYTQANISQQILAQVTDEDGCVSWDTVTIETHAELTFDSIIVTDVFIHPPLDPNDPGMDTLSTTTFRDEQGELWVCDQDVIFFEPFVTGGVQPLQFRWNADQPVEVYDLNMNLIDGIPPMMDFDSLMPAILGFRLTGDTVSQVTFTISVIDAIGTAGPNGITRTITVHFLKRPYVKLHASPRMHDNAYYENQAVYFEISPRKFTTYEFYRMIREDGAFDYVLTPQNRTNPQKGASPVFATTFVEGEGDNLMIGIAQDTNGCKNQDSIQVRLLQVPNVVIPDDEIYPANRVFLPAFDIEVFDTWGLKIKDFGTSGWDATYKGKTVRSGTYYYNAKVPTLDGVTIISGAVTVIKQTND